MPDAACGEDAYETSGEMSPETLRRIKANRRRHQRRNIPIKAAVAAAARLPGAAEGGAEGPMNAKDPAAVVLPTGPVDCGVADVRQPGAFGDSGILGDIRRFASGVEKAAMAELTETDFPLDMNDPEFELRQMQAQLREEITELVSSITLGGEILEKYTEEMGSETVSPQELDVHLMEMGFPTTKLIERQRTLKRACRELVSSIHCEMMDFVAGMERARMLEGAELNACMQHLRVTRKVLQRHQQWLQQQIPTFGSKCVGIEKLGSAWGAIRYELRRHYQFENEVEYGKAKHLQLYNMHPRAAARHLHAYHSYLRAPGKYLQPNRHAMRARFEAEHRGLYNSMHARAGAQQHQPYNAMPKGAEAKHLQLVPVGKHLQVYSPMPESDEVYAPMPVAYLAPEYGNFATGYPYR